MELLLQRAKPGMAVTEVCKVDHLQTLKLLTPTTQILPAFHLMANHGILWVSIMPPACLASFWDVRYHFSFGPCQRLFHTRCLGTCTSARPCAC